MLNVSPGPTARPFLPFLLACLLLAGCQSTSSYYQGYQANADSSVELIAPGSQTGNWKTFDLELAYDYSLSGNQLQISGGATLSDYYDFNVSRIRSLALYLFFLDDSSLVQETVLLAQSLDSRTDQTLGFERDLQVPAGSSRIAFGYRGESTGEGGGSSKRGVDSREFFSNLPQRPAAP